MSELTHKVELARVGEDGDHSESEDSIFIFFFNGLQIRTNHAIMFYRNHL